MAEHRADKKDGWQRYNWTLIEFDYTMNPDMSLRKIAKKYGCNIKTVARHSKKDNWYQKRIDHHYAIVRGAIIKQRMKDFERFTLEVINEDLASFGLDPIDDIGDKLRAELLKETEERVDSGEWWFI